MQLGIIMHMRKRLKLQTDPALAIGPAAESESLNLFVQANIMRRNWVNAVAPCKTSDSILEASADRDEAADDCVCVRFHGRGISHGTCTDGL